MKITYEQIVKLEPCGFYGEEDGRGYTPSRIRKLMGGEEFVTPREIHDHPDVPWEDKYWLFSCLLPERDRHELACRVAEASLQYIDDEELLAVCKAAINAKRAWLDGKISDAELAAAGSAAWSAAWSAAESAAWSAARGAAWHAAGDTAGSAARLAAWSAAWYVAGSAAGSAARYAAGSAARHAAGDAAWHAAAAGDAAWHAAWKRLCDIALEMTVERSE